MNVLNLRILTVLVCILRQKLRLQIEAKEALKSDDPMLWMLPRCPYGANSKTAA
jgi:hypothetical protein